MPPKKLYERGPQWVDDPKEVEARKTREWPKTWEIGKHTAPFKPGEANLTGKKPPAEKIKYPKGWKPNEYTDT